VNRSYQEFIASKQLAVKPFGFDLPMDLLNANLFDWQKRIVQWALKRGRAALFEDTGLGKTLQQLSWAEAVCKHTGKPVVVHTPVGVRHQTKREAEKFAIDCRVEVVDDTSGIVDGINLVNYEKLHKFDASIWGGVVLDESGVLKNFTGVIKRGLCDAYRNTEYRLACTATPAPNDHMELGNHADFLGIMPSNEMLSRWFINDTMRAGGYRLKGHAKTAFWEWVASWAVCISKPSDIGGDDVGYDLPKLQINRHIISIPFDGQASGFLFDVAGISATNIHEEKRRANEERAKRVAEIVSQSDGPHLVWCYTDYEANALKAAMPQAVEVRGSHKDEVKEQRLHAFAKGDIACLITKPSIAGMGMNFQACSHQVFAGQSFSFEEYYQAVRRSWRFGQKNEVTIDIVVSDAESQIEKTIARKESDHLLMHKSMAEVMKQIGMTHKAGLLRTQLASGSQKVNIPSWLKTKKENYVCD
jgi:hypothetical protein